MPEPSLNGPCAVCGARGLACGRCRATFYCGRDHQRQDWQSHREHCRLAERDDPAAVPEHLAQASSALLRLPEAALLAVCGYLNGLDLLRLGLVCRGLRHLARHPRAWEHVDWENDPSTWSVGNKADALAKGHLAVLRVAPALRSVKLDAARPRVDPLRCTHRVRVFEMEMCSDDTGCEEYHAGGEKVDIARLVALLRHYKDHVQVVKLDALKTIKVLDTIDTLPAIRELYVNRDLMKVWPQRGTDKTVTTMDFWHQASADVAARLVAAARDTLKSFKVDGFRIYKNDVACSSKVGRALGLCSNLETANIPIWDKMSLLNSFPKLRRLCLFDLGFHDHADVKRYLASRPAVLRGLEALAVHLGFNAHRGIIKALAAACTELPVLRIMHTNTACTELSCQVDVARDLHKLLQPMKKLKHLLLSVARVPSSVFHGLRQGALPSLEVLTLRFCGVTAKGRAALEALKACRPSLQVKEHKVTAARRKPKPRTGPFNPAFYHRPDPRSYMDPFMSMFGGQATPPAQEGRCMDGFCRQASDCEEDDPVVEDNSSHSSRGLDMDLDWMSAVGDGDDSMDDISDEDSDGDDF